MTEQKKEHLLFIDLAKGITMLTILWGHVMLSGISNTIVYAFHIPMFFFLSGMVFKRERYTTFFAFFKKRVRTLLIPYIIFSVLTWLWYICGYLVKGASLEGTWYYLIQTFLAQGSAGYLVHNPALWFVTCLFVVEMIYYFISRFSPVTTCIISALLSFCGWLMMQPNSFFDFKKLPWNIEVALSAIIFYALGNILSSLITNKKHINYLKSHKLLSISIIILSSGVLCIGGIYNGHVSMAQGYLGNSGILFYGIAFFGIIFMLYLSLFLETAYGSFKFADQIIKYFAWMGKNSFYIMVLHIPIMLVCVKIIAFLTNNDSSAIRYNYIYTLPAWLGMILGCNILIYILGKLKKTRFASFLFFMN